MRHSFIDEYSHLGSPVHRVSSVLKVVFTASLLVYLATTEDDFRYYLFPALVALLGLIFSRVPLWFILKRVLVILPFVLFLLVFLPFTQHYGWEMVVHTGIRSSLSVLLLILLVATTPFPELLKALSRLGLPRVLVVILSFMYRYFFVLQEEAEHMGRAVEMRRFAERGFFKSLRIWAQVTGVLFIRSYERSERVYQAMLLRGFEGEMPE